ncbi:unnamed protein product [Trichobilharzia regenti]|nr:unnamed protein product [Trichobilharzia regenti]
MKFCEPLIIKLAKRAFSFDEIKVRGKGLNFTIFVNRLKPEGIIDIREVALSKIDKTTAEQVRAQCVLTIKRQKKGRSNLSQKELAALKSLRNDKSIVIAKADEGYTTVVMDKSDYINKASQYIETAPYEGVQKPMNTIINKIKKSTSVLVSRMKSSLGESKWFNLVPKTSNPGRMYGTIKILKAG